MARVVGIEPWVPAFAGMTAGGWVVVCPPNNDIDGPALARLPVELRYIFAGAEQEGVGDETQRLVGDVGLALLQ